MRDEAQVELVLFRGLAEVALSILYPLEGAGVTKAFTRM